VGQDKLPLDDVPQWLGYQAWPGEGAGCEDYKGGPDNPEGSASSATSTVISNRANARMRAASRRTQQAAEDSSSDEVASEQQNQLQPRTRQRLRRRRHQSGSTQGQRGQMSQEPAAVVEEVGQRSRSEPVRAPHLRQQAPIYKQRAACFTT